LRKQVLVTVDQGETRVAILEAEGDPAAASNKEQPKGRSRRGRGRQKPPQDWRVGELYVERRGSRSIVGNVY
jgi:ribonuclease G